MTTIQGLDQESIDVSRDRETTRLQLHTSLEPRNTIFLFKTQVRELRDELTRILGDAPEPPVLRMVPPDLKGQGAEPATGILSGRGHPKFRDLLEEIWRDKHCLKAAGYGLPGDPLANLRASEAIGIPSWIGSWVRAKDKAFRIDQAAKRASGIGPGLWRKVRSDLLELAAYCLLIVILFEERGPGSDPEAAA